jgi:hypothetical protein
VAIHLEFSVDCRSRQASFAMTEKFWEGFHTVCHARSYEGERVEFERVGFTQLPAMTRITYWRRRATIRMCSCSPESFSASSFV